MNEPKARRVRVGYYVDPLPPVLSIRAHLKLGRLVGADDFWFSDHTRHTIPRDYWREQPMSRLIPDLDAWFDPTVVIGRFCRPGGPRMGTWVTDAVRRTPQDLARAFLTLHHLTKGNVVLGIGAGEVMNVESQGLSLNRAASRLEGALEGLRAAFQADGTYVTHEGPFHSWTNAAFPPPYRGTVPPIWVGAQGPRTCRATGRLGDGWFNTSENFDRFQELARSVAGGAAAEGRDLDRMEWSQNVVCVLASNRRMFVQACAAPLVKTLALAMSADHWAHIGATHPFGPDFAGVFGYRVDDDRYGAEALRDGGRVVTPELVEALLPSGTADRAMERIAPYVESGVSHLTTLNAAVSAGLGSSVDALRQAARLNRELKRMAPGSRAWATDKPCVEPQSGTEERGDQTVPS